MMKQSNVTTNLPFPNFAGVLQNGQNTGRKRIMTESKIASARKLLADCTPPADVAKDLGISVPTLYRWVPVWQQ